MDRLLRAEACADSDLEVRMACSDPTLHLTSLNFLNFLKRRLALALCDLTTDFFFLTLEFVPSPRSRG